MMIGPNVKTETLREATSVVTLAIRSLTPAMACSKSSLVGSSQGLYLKLL